MSWLEAIHEFRRSVLGLNRRNQDYVFRYNTRALFHLVDDKLATKATLAAHQIPVPRTYAVFRVPWDIRRLRRSVQRLDDFVIKPIRGSGGGGVLVITSRRGQAFLKGDERALAIEDLEDHVADILGGAYSRNQRHDEAIIEYRVRVDPVLGALSYRGVPDVRVVVFQGVPVLAMLRLPTRRSDGRANLHMGGLGVGIDLATGRTSWAWGAGGPIHLHPDLEVSLLDVAIPHWEALLDISARCADAIALGYFGADLVIDAELGPLILELNARPGLSIQLANRRGLRPVLEEVERREPRGLGVTERVEIGKQIFASAL